jgi:pimeloyl-ACP methyl ester carboxylesterase
MPGEKRSQKSLAQPDRAHATKAAPARGAGQTHRTSLPASGPPTVSGRWMLVATGIAIAAAGACAWLTLCFLFWQGSWQLLYHPAAAVRRTPASVGLAFDPVAFATTEAGVPRLKGWWIAGEAPGRLTAIYLHGASGNVGDTVDALKALHDAGMNVLAFDYRGYGQSEFAHPGEAHWREDADSAIGYLTHTRHIPATSLVLFGQGLGANLAIEEAAAHPELGGVVLDTLLSAPEDTIFNDPRARLVPARLLVRDRWDLNAAAASVLIPSLWFCRTQAERSTREAEQTALSRVTARSQQVWLPGASEASESFGSALRRWLDDLPPSPVAL